MEGLDVFNRFNLKPIRPFVLALAHACSPAEFEKAILLLASLSVRLVTASRTRSGTIETTFAEPAVKVFEKTVTNTAGLRAALAKVIVSDADFFQEFAVARVSNPGLARYYLRALEAANASENETWYVEGADLPSYPPKIPRLVGMSQHSLAGEPVRFRKLAALASTRTLA